MFTPLAAHAVSLPPNLNVSGPISPIGNQILAERGGISAAQWNEIANPAEHAGDRLSANAAREVASSLSTTKSGNTTQPQNLVNAVLKRALITALRNGGKFLPAKIRPWAYKIANAIEGVSDFQQGTLISAMQFTGIPYDIAYTASLWIVVFLGF